jgi:hypothetical protein
MAQIYQWELIGSARPSGLVDANGVPISSTNPLPVSLSVDAIDAEVTNDGTFAKESGGNLAAVLAALQGILGVHQTDLSTTGTINAAQPTESSAVSGATVVLAVGLGQSTWKAQLANGGGGFTSATTIVADKSPDGGATWYAASFKVTGASPATPQSSVTGPGPLEITGNCAGVTHVRVRCSVLNASETIAVALRAGSGVSDVGLLSSIPAGSNNIGALSLAVAVADYGSNPSATGIGTDVLFKWGTAGITQVNHVSIQNNTAANVLYAFDQDTTTSGHKVYTLAAGQAVFWDRAVTTLHFQTAAAQNFGGTAGITVEGFA